MLWRHFTLCIANFEREFILYRSCYITEASCLVLRSRRLRGRRQVAGCGDKWREETMRPPAGAAIMLAPVPRHLPARHGRIHRATRLSRLPITLPDQVHRRLTFASSFKTFIACPEWLSRERNRAIQDAVMESLRTKNWPCPQKGVALAKAWPLAALALT